MQGSSFPKIIRRLREVAGELPDFRKGKNTRYTMADIALSAFSVFFTQCPSFLSFQKAMEEARGRNNARSLFEVEICHAITASNEEKHKSLRPLKAKLAQFQRRHKELGEELQRYLVLARQPGAGHFGQETLAAAEDLAKQKHELEREIEKVKIDIAHRERVVTDEQIISDALLAFEGRMSSEYLRSLPHQTAAESLPAPPLRGTKFIRPILTYDELVQEARSQDNCVATYAARIRKRTTFIYRVTHPERATLSIVRGPDGDWRIGELECRDNTKVSPTTRLAVESWLDQYALSD